MKDQSKYFQHIQELTASYLQINQHSGLNSIMPSRTVSNRIKEKRFG